MPQIDETDYDKVISAIFSQKFDKLGNSGVEEIEFTLSDLAEVVNQLGITVKNIPDIPYTYRSRRALPESILTKGNWIIKQKGKGKLAFIKTKREPFVQIQAGLAVTEIPNALPEIVEKYTASDEQGLLSAIRYNRLIDVFTELTCFHLQSHIRTTIQSEGQVEIDDLYVGLDQDGREYILPLEAKSDNPRDSLGWFQVANLVRYAHQNFPKLKCRPICAKPIDRNTVHLLEFEDDPDYNTVSIKNIKLYKLVRKQSNEQTHFFDLTN
jgi:hypothetical protein